jgi:hypothetical protein
MKTKVDIADILSLVRKIRKTCDSLDVLAAASQVIGWKVYVHLEFSHSMKKKYFQYYSV